jgi:hypothetical protein
MNKSKKILKKIMNKSKKFSKKLTKTIKNKSTLKKCEQFCKKDYMIEMRKIFKKNSEKYNIPYKSPTKEEDEFAYNTCKKTFCNEKCEGYDFFGDKQKQIDFKKKIKNGFQDTYSTNKVEMFKKRGALSGCVDIVDYDVFHK